MNKMLAIPFHLIYAAATLRWKFTFASFSKTPPIQFSMEMFMNLFCIKFKLIVWVIIILSRFGQNINITEIFATLCLIPSYVLHNFVT